MSHFYSCYYYKSNDYSDASVKLQGTLHIRCTALLGVMVVMVIEAAVFIQQYVGGVCSACTTNANDGLIMFPLVGPNTFVDRDEGR